MTTRQASIAIDNVVAFRPAQSRPRPVYDPKLTDYVKEVNLEMFSKAGVHYLAIRTSLHGEDNDAIRSYMDRGIEVPKAVAEIMQAHGLKSVNAKVTPQLAAAYNKVQAAISEFVASSDDWHRSFEGHIYREIDGGLAFLRPVPYSKQSPNEPDSFGFGIEVREGAAVDYQNFRISDFGVCSERFAGWDLDRPCDGLTAHLTTREETNSFKF